LKNIRVFFSDALPGLKMVIFLRRFVVGPAAMKIAGKLAKIYVKKH